MKGGVNARNVAKGNRGKSTSVGKGQRKRQTCCTNFNQRLKTDCVSRRFGKERRFASPKRDFASDIRVQAFEMIDLSRENFAVTC
jgi:hypothetical protein